MSKFVHSIKVLFNYMLVYNDRLSMLSLPTHFKHQFMTNIKSFWLSFLRNFDFRVKMVECYSKFITTKRSVERDRKIFKIYTTKNTIWNSLWLNFIFKKANVDLMGS